MFVNNLESEELKNTDMKSLAVPVLYTLYEYFYFSFNIYCIKLRIDTSCGKYNMSEVFVWCFAGSYNSSRQSSRFNREMG